jgi:hypothetical protein
MLHLSRASTRVNGMVLCSALKWLKSFELSCRVNCRRRRSIAARRRHGRVMRQSQRAAWPTCVWPPSRSSASLASSPVCTSRRISAMKPRCETPHVACRADCAADAPSPRRSPPIGGGRSCVPSVPTRRCTGREVKRHRFSSVLANAKNDLAKNHNSEPSVTILATASEPYRVPRRVTCPSLSSRAAMTLSDSP